MRVTRDVSTSLCMIYGLVLLRDVCHSMKLSKRRYASFNLPTSHTALSTLVLPSLKLPRNGIQYRASISNFFEDSKAVEVLVEEAKLHEPPNSISSYATWIDALNETGWNHLNVSFHSSNTHMEDGVKAYLAGVLEGYLTCKRLKEFLLNLNDLYYRELPTKNAFTNLTQDVSRSITYARNLVGWNPQSPFRSRVARETNVSPLHRQMWLILLQMHGIVDAYNAAYHHGIISASPITIVDLSKLSSDGDILNLILQSNRELKRMHLHKNENCHRHTTWEPYSEMTRVIKYYNFPYLDAAAKTLALTSYPGIITSTDDFILASTGIAVTETSIDIANENILCDPRHVHLERAPDYMLPLIATRLAQTNSEWARIIASGATNFQSVASCQWMVVSYSHFASGERGRRRSPLLVVAEVVPGSLKIKDMSKVLRQKGYWASVNKAAFHETQTVVGDNHNTNYAREFLFSHAAKNVNTVEDMQHLMQFSVYLPRQNVSTPESTLMSIAPRFDLDQKNPHFEGATDSKIVTLGMIKSLSFIGISGPEHRSDTPFKWIDTGKTLNPWPHRGLPQLWNFTWQYITPHDLQAIPPNAKTSHFLSWERHLIEEAQQYVDLPQTII